MHTQLSHRFPSCVGGLNISSNFYILPLHTVGSAAITALLDTHASLFMDACMLILIRILYHACVSFRMMKSVLLIWTSFLNDHIKLKGQYTYVKSGCPPSVGPTLQPHSSVKTKLWCSCPFKLLKRKKKYKI